MRKAAEALRQTAHALSQPPTPFSMLYASFRLKATNDSAQFFSHIKRHLDFLLQTSGCIKQYLDSQLVWY